MLSLRAQAKPKEANPAGAAAINVESHMTGHMQVADRAIDLSNVQYDLPGAQVLLDGRYTMDGKTFEFHGIVRTKAKLSQMTTGIKSALLKPIDPIFHKNGAGTQIPFKISGTKDEPHFGLDLHDKNRAGPPRSRRRRSKLVCMARKKVLLSWSGGKDSAWALHLLRQDASLEVVALLTTINEVFRRVAVHGFREELLDRQAAATGLPLWKIDLPFPCTNEIYEAKMAKACERMVAEGIEAVAFGDLFLEDIRAYRIAKARRHRTGTALSRVGHSHRRLAKQMLAGGLRARLTTVDPRHLDASFAGREFNAALLADLPAGVDPCGERGEFHSFCFAGPMFAQEIPVEYTHTVLRDGFAYADLVPATL